ncbi:helix-turn-helix domain-containing protein [Alteromonas sp. ASW11-130]|uniref:helix-turn-helix domain-containing protein n=1 Tax=Alteromonas sp. ASW11-130 TaxID=3015775 RepID=UPI0022420B66|nr:LuxR C-terminal-related transcriptional regulator [Alteromonas sp. ASW11-130]MCW8091918.1 LuxR C-terminal-related transcriptional regulator [Alteromonas sp. ASW11-130]
MMLNTQCTKSMEDKLSQLSKRELQVAHKIMEGLPNKRIASQLFISERTVKFHCANIYRKLEIRDRAALMAAYFRQLYQLQASDM